MTRGSLRWRCESFLFDALWRHKLQWRHIHSSIGVSNVSTFHWCTDCEQMYKTVAAQTFLTNPRISTMSSFSFKDIMTSWSTTASCSSKKWWLGSETVRTLDLRSRGRGFDSRFGRYQVLSTWKGDCLRTGKPSRYKTNNKVNSAFHPSGVGKSSTGLHGWG